MGSQSELIRVRFLKLPPRQAAAIVGVALVCMTIACAEPARQTQPSPAAVQPSPSAITFTLTNSNCAAEGIGAVIQGQFVAVVINTTSSRAAFNLQRLIDGRTYQELELFIQARQQAIASGRDTPAVPPMVTHVAGVFVEPGQRGKVEATLSSGTYDLVCRRDSPGGLTAEAIYVHGPYRVN